MKGVIYTRVASWVADVASMAPYISDEVSAKWLSMLVQRLVCL